MELQEAADGDAKHIKRKIMKMMFQNYSSNQQSKTIVQKELLILADEKVRADIGVYLHKLGYNLVHIGGVLSAGHVTSNQDINTYFNGLL
jgi:hypothetical protein